MIKDIPAFCRLFYLSTGIPVSCYHIPDESSSSFPEIPYDQSIFIKYLFPGTRLKKNPDYYFAQSLCHFGSIYVSSQKTVVILGPVFSTPVSDSVLHSFMLEWAVSPDARDELAAILSAIPLYPVSRFVQTLALAHFALNDEEINAGTHFGLEDTGIIASISNAHSDHVINARETQQLHNTYRFEQQLSSLIQNGDVLNLRKLLAESAILHQGVMADNTLRQEKNIFITTTTLVTRSAVIGGMDVEQAYNLSDLYIQECERSQDIAHISSLSYAMIIDFAERVSQTKIPQGMSPEIFQCIQFIAHHINEPVRVSDVAEYIGRSRSYLTAKFKKELGFDISHFIMRYKLEEAKSLLTYSDKSLGEISSYLSFSSQSYFQNVFKKKYGITPLQYRNRSLLERRVPVSGSD
ncbi:hypothetical protein B5F07_02805 [Lachnoclostridium sp. An169]|uniref:helix-turn-helix domain-containing protein n=1 Tax=Lachnoclostridium sp. An169 TaxID=1965569 RepID=UPI000B3707F1|nr:helix-turn-helix domain-containing protein [Lachnoclostridium sp. An169]OUP86236.1 hypothetical protein B5F07_02805 [Lachnoclostridium sp. An169]HJA67612.1 AraC family transcriptional regulator [Candidatus Mediterraneibacter cottocaccae]